MAKKDPIEQLGHTALLEMAYDIQVQLERGTAKGMRPVLWLLTEQRKKAAEAILKLILVDASEEIAIRQLQSEVRLYGDLIDHCRALFSRGRDAEQQIMESDRAEMEDLVGNMSPEERRQFNLQPGSED